MDSTTSNCAVSPEKTKIECVEGAGVSVTDQPAKVPTPTAIEVKTAALESNMTAVSTVEAIIPSTTTPASGVTAVASPPPTPIDVATTAPPVPTPVTPTTATEVSPIVPTITPTPATTSSPSPVIDQPHSTGTPVPEVTPTTPVATAAPPVDPPPAPPAASPTTPYPPAVTTTTAPAPTAATPSQAPSQTSQTPSSPNASAPSQSTPAPTFKLTTAPGNATPSPTSPPPPSSDSVPNVTPSSKPQSSPQATTVSVPTMNQTLMPLTTVPPTTKTDNVSATSSDVSTPPTVVTVSATETPPFATLSGSIDRPYPSTQSTSPALVESPLPTPTASNENSEQRDAGFSATVIAISGGVVFLVIVLATVLVRVAQTKRRRRTFGYEEDVGAKYQDMSSPRKAAGTTMSVPWAGSALATSRISLDKIQRGPIISQGGYGEVSRGYYNGQEVAIKRPLISRRRDLVSIHDFLEEIKLTATLDHECIAKFIGVAWDAPSDMCMVSEYVPGGDLRSLLSRRAREGGARGFDDDKLRIAMQIAHALTYMHTLQPAVVHRDLKSRNVLLTAQMDAKLIDFGVSTERCDVTMTAGVGTSLWMAPEMMLGQRYDEKADVFSFGVMLSELDTHELPYSHVRESLSGRLINDLVVMQLVSQGQLTPQFSETADPRIVELARDCLQLDPMRRPSASEVLYLIHRARRAGALI